MEYKHVKIFWKISIFLYKRHLFWYNSQRNYILCFSLKIIIRFKICNVNQNYEIKLVLIIYDVINILYFNEIMKLLKNGKLFLLL